MAKNKPTNKENKGTNTACKSVSQPPGKAAGKKMTLEEKKQQLIRALERIELQEQEAKRQEEMERIRLRELESLMPALIPTFANGYNLNKRILADVYLKELSHHIFLVWSDGLYGNKPIDIRVIRAAIEPLILEGKKFQLCPENIFIMAVQTKSRIQPTGSCFVLLPKGKVGEDETEILHRMARHHSRMFIVDKLMLTKHMKMKHLLIFTNGYKDYVRTIPPQYIKALKPVGLQGDLKEQSKDRISPDVVQQAAVTKVISCATPQPETIKHIQVSEEVLKTKEDEMNEQAISSDNLESSTQSESEDSESDYCEIIGAPIIEQPPLVMDEPFLSANREFIPVTEDTLSNALALMDKYHVQGRAVAIVFDSCFFLEGITMKLIKEKFKDIFGDIGSNQVLIRINSPKLAKNLDEAEKLGIKTINQAYIIAQQGLTDSDLNRKAAARNVFCCPMTLGCVVNNLKRGVFMMHNDALAAQIQPSESTSPPVKRLTTSESDNITELTNTSNKSNESITSKGSNSSASKRNRIAASLGTTTEVPKAKKEQLHKSADVISNVDEKFLESLKQQGDTVIEIDNLPAKLSILALNLTMGTFTLKPEQVIASLKQVKGDNLDLMDVRIVINKDNKDVERILSKNGCKTCYSSKLVIGLGNHKKLLKFIQTRSKTLRRMDANMNLPMNKIGYSTESRP